MQCYLMICNTVVICNIMVVCSVTGTPTVVTGTPTVVLTCNNVITISSSSSSSSSINIAINVPYVVLTGNEIVICKISL